jgi:cell fate (sporulation/competence/biofilm development) regulator YlbF (YheA/YmcA/DUF963 family)
VGKAIDTTAVQTVISVPLSQTASALAENLVQSEPFLRFQEADRKLHGDQEAMGLLAEAAAVQKKVRSQGQSGDISERDISSNDTIREQEKARALAVDFLREVNQEISNLIGIDFSTLTRRSGGCC